MSETCWVCVDRVQPWLDDEGNLHEDIHRVCAQQFAVGVSSGIEKP